MTTSTNQPGETFTFPTGTTMELPAGMLPCLKPDTVTHDTGRFIPVGTTPAGRTVFSHYSCAAYTRAAHMHDMQQANAKLRTRAAELEAQGLTIKAGNLRTHAARREDEFALIFAEWADDPAPCTCK
ncbi:hypothetical protein EDD90_2813 [Streptomyces sp. Ag109_O5-1]|uniref:hypothetical protein n=1 Tax=Streptomyces sp. Ag109_O5-1 TaxID=1938851 RepID=UPI000F50A37D|nr:hypothetical protein [Streptomyces sp. Ag109_O5-1]RPE39795.1 hypothetical protein EDD90_2813 [Streptomyces sp. Ag109_O5-1]